MSHSRHAQTRLLTRSILLMCAVGLWIGSGRPAFATCGDYLRGHQSPDRVTLDDVPDDRDSLPTPRPTPICNGPQCQRHTPVPAAPSKAVELSASSDAIVAAITSVLIRDAQQPGPTVPLAVVVNGTADRVFRPPRAL